MKKENKNSFSTTRSFEVKPTDKTLLFVNGKRYKFPRKRNIIVKI